MGFSMDFLKKISDLYIQILTPEHSSPSYIFTIPKFYAFPLISCSPLPLIHSQVSCPKIVQSMSPERFLLTQKYSIARIISSPSSTARLSFRLISSQGSAPLARSLTKQPRITTAPQDDPLSSSTPKTSLKDRAKLIKSVDFQRSIQKQDLDLRRLRVEPLCGDIALRKHIRPVFKSIVQKYKRSFHPSNASRGQNNTSDDPFMKTPRRIREMRERYNTEDNRNEIRRLVNNRKQVRMRRNKTQSRSLSIH